MSYREDANVEINARLGALETAVNELDVEVKDKYTWPIVKAIASKIKAFNIDIMWGVMAWLCISGVIAFGGYAAYRAAGADDIVDSCLYNVDDDKWFVYAQVDWSNNKRFGPFETLEETRALGKINGCPN